MSMIQKEVQKEIQKLEKMLKRIETFQNKAPEGCLKYQKKKGKVYFFQQYRNKQTKQWNRTYIKRENASLVSRLAQKHYYSIMQPILEKHMKLLKDFAQQYHPEEIDKTFEDLSDVRKAFVMPMPDTKEERIRKWYEEVYEKNDMYEENLRYETEQGEVVRSKSEVIIANMLNQHKADILYKYERPLELQVDGKVKMIYPDFTVLNIRTGKIVYWEHAGRMDDPYYANEFVKKMNTYMANDLLPGRDVVLTFESSENVLDIAVVKKVVRGMCSDVNT